MKKLAAFLAMLSLLSLVPTAFAADSDLPAYSRGENRRVSGAASDVPHQVTSDISRQAASDVPRPEASNVPRSADLNWQAGGLRQPGLYMGSDGVYHHVPKLQDPRMRIY